METKQCYGCKEKLTIDNFTKNKNMPDGLSYYCRECSKRNYNLYKYKRSDDDSYAEVVISELEKHDIPINGFDIDKINNLHINLYDFPGIIRPLLKDLPIFCKKYNLTYEEYKFIIDACRSNNFFIKPKGLNTKGN